MIIIDDIPLVGENLEINQILLDLKKKDHAKDSGKKKSVSWKEKH